MCLRIGLLVIGMLATTHAAASEPTASEPAQAAAVKRQHVLVHLNCSPTDEKAVTDTLRVALSCCDNMSVVTLFIDLQAVALAKSELEDLPKEQAINVGDLFNKLRLAKVQVLVCPHCAGQFGVEADRIRKGTRFTTKEEFEEVTKNADKVLEYKAEVNGRSDSSCGQKERTGE